CGTIYPVCNGIVGSHETCGSVIHNRPLPVLQAHRRTLVIRFLLTCAAILAVSACPLFGDVILPNGSPHEFSFVASTSEARPCFVMGMTVCTSSINPDDVDKTASPPRTLRVRRHCSLSTWLTKAMVFAAYDFAVSLCAT